MLEMTRVLIRSETFTKAATRGWKHECPGVFSGELETHLARHAHSCTVVLQVSTFSRAPSLYLDRGSLKIK